MSRHTCPNCGHGFTTTTAKAEKPQPILSDDDVNTAQMDLKALYAHYKATAPLADVRFALQHLAGYSLELRAGYEALELAILHTKPTRAAIYREYGRLQDLWRAESNVRDRAERQLHAADCRARYLFNGECDCGRMTTPTYAEDRESAIDRILAAYGAPNVRGLLCA